MVEAQHSGGLGTVYEAKRPEEIAALYDGWAETYDAEMATAGYRHPTICLALMARHLPRGAAPPPCRCWHRADRRVARPHGLSPCRGA